jgi:hypothetical protein
MKYITLFETDAAYKAATLDLPNVSLIEENMNVSYTPWVESETKLVCKYNVTDTSSPTVLRTSYEQNIFKSMEIDGVMLDELVTDYTFDTVGEHTVKYELYDETKLGNSAPVFYNGNLVECIIPDSVTYIGQNVFNSCSGLTSVTIGNSVTDIGGSAFTNCTGLTSIVIPDSVITIGSGAFYGCSGLTSCTICNGVTDINMDAFKATDALKVLNYNAKCELSTSFRGDWKNLETVIIGDSTSSIGSGALSECTSLTSVTIGSGVTSFGDSAFANCSNLTSVNISDGVTSIGRYAFYGCTGLTSINIPNSVTSIGSSAFNRCESLTSCTIGSGVTSIFDGAFEYCNSLTSIDIPNSVTSIEKEAFKGCSSLSSVTIGSGVTNIKESVFQNCRSLISIVSNAATAPSIYGGTFNGVHTDGVLTVPSGSSGYDVWMGTGNYYLGKYNWTKVEQ